MAGPPTHYYGKGGGGRTEDSLANPFSTLETNILAAKGLTPEHMEALVAAGISTKEDLKTVGDPATLLELIQYRSPYRSLS